MAFFCACADGLRASPHLLTMFLSSARSLRGTRTCVQVQLELPVLSVTSSTSGRTTRAKAAARPPRGTHAVPAYTYELELRAAVLAGVRASCVCVRVVCVCVGRCLQPTAALAHEISATAFKFRLVSRDTHTLQLISTPLDSNSLT